MELEWLQKIGEQNSEGKRELLSRYKPYSTRTFQIVLPLALFLFLNKITWTSLPESEKSECGQILRLADFRFSLSWLTWAEYSQSRMLQIMWCDVWCLVCATPTVGWASFLLALIAPVQTLSSGKKKHAIFLKAWGLGVDEATDDPVPTPHRLCQQVPARSSTRIEGGRDRDVTYTRCPYYSCSIRPDVASIPSHTRHRCPLSCSVRQQGACSRRRHPRRDGFF